MFPKKYICKYACIDFSKDNSIKIQSTLNMAKCLLIYLFLFLMMGNAQARLLNAPTFENDTYDAEVLFHVLTAEMHHQYGDDISALESYQYALLLSDDTDLAKRATLLATATAQLKQGLTAAKKWVSLSPNELEARQYYALLLIREEHYSEAVEQLQHIIKHVTNHGETTKDGLAFIGALLAQEAHHKKAHFTFKQFIKMYGKESNDVKAQQNLILANLAMKAKDYASVAHALSDHSNYVEEDKIDAISLKAKALRKLNRSNEAIVLLESIHNNPITSDSTRLELVRLWVLNDNKNKALALLLKLVDKHEKNHELLKSLIALQIDLQKLDPAEKNIRVLIETKNYRNDAHYFSGKIAELREKYPHALKEYEAVKGGSFIKSAHKKIMRLTQYIHGDQALELWLQDKLDTSARIGDQAYWMKLQADNLFEAGKYQTALEKYNRAITLSPTKIDYRLFRALTHQRLKQFEDAEKDLKHIIHKRKNNAEALHALGSLLLEDSERFDEAMNYIQQAHQIKPNNVAILDSLGWALYKSGEFSRARVYLERAYAKKQSIEIAGHLMQILKALGLKQEAVKVFDEIKLKYPISRELVSLQKILN